MLPFVGVGLKVQEELHLDKKGGAMAMKFAKLYTPEKIGVIVRRAKTFAWWMENPTAAFMKSVGLVNKEEKKEVTGLSGEEDYLANKEEKSGNYNKMNHSATENTQYQKVPCGRCNKEVEAYYILSHMTKGLWTKCPECGNHARPYIGNLNIYLKPSKSYLKATQAEAPQALSNGKDYKPMGNQVTQNTDTLWK